MRKNKLRGVRKRAVSLLHDFGVATGDFRRISASAVGFEAVAFGGAVKLDPFFLIFIKHTCFGLQFPQVIYRIVLDWRSLSCASDTPSGALRAGFGGLAHFGFDLHHVEAALGGEGLRGLRIEAEQSLQSVAGGG